MDDIAHIIHYIGMMKYITDTVILQIYDCYCRHSTRGESSTSVVELLAMVSYWIQVAQGNGGIQYGKGITLS